MKTFSHFNDGVKISDSRINSWLSEVRDRIFDGKTHSTMSSGDTSVIGLVWDSEIEFIVCTSSGRSTMRFSKYDELDLLRNYKFNYSRPVGVLTNS